jgi:hypothetical protein
VTITPHASCRYEDLVAANKRRAHRNMEYKIVNERVFDADRYFDVFADDGTHAAEDIVTGISVANRGPKLAAWQMLPTAWLRRA